tara:strand:+ start:55953 stop:57830 length:1878 start_codon:yes stop_codon:yes gene_type:complete
MKTKKRILLVNPTIPSESIELPFLYLLLKSYYRENGANFDSWDWLPPLEDISFFGFHDLIKHIVSIQPDVIGFSCLIWNRQLNFDLAKEVKKRLPGVLIAFGGPDLTVHENENWFIENSFVDIVCQYPGRGEEFFTSLLDQIAEDKISPEKIPYSLYLDSKDRKIKKSLVEKKTVFNWPENIFNEAKDFDIDLQKIYKKSSYLATNWETTRGCPYRCTYCEWGGGTNTKVLTKPDHIIKNELDYIDAMGINEVRITDANFGIFKERDLNIIKQLVEISKKGNLKQIYLFGKSKNNWDVNEEIDTLLIEAGLTERDSYHLAINGTNDRILSAIKRKNIPLDVLLTKALQIKNKYNLRLKFEIVLGLPESNLKSFYDELCLLDRVDDWTTERYAWSLLPGTPASEPSYIEQYKIKTSQIRFHVGGDLRAQVYNKGETHLLTNLVHQSQYAIVTSTASYSQQDWAEMYFMDHLTRAMELSGFFTEIRKHVQKQFSISAADFYKFVWKSLDYLPDEPAKLIESVKEQIFLVIAGKSKNQFSYFDNPFVPSMTIKLEAYFNMFYFLYHRELMQCLGQVLPGECHDFINTLSLKHSTIFKDKNVRELFELATQPFLNKVAFLTQPKTCLQI